MALIVVGLFIGSSIVYYAGIQTGGVRHSDCRFHGVHRGVHVGVLDRARYSHQGTQEEALTMSPAGAVRRRGCDVPVGDARRAMRYDGGMVRCRIKG